jgi:hypothetical protein
MIAKRGYVVEEVRYKAANPWPAPEPLKEIPDTVVRKWLVTLENHLQASEESLQQTGRTLSTAVTKVELYAQTDVLLQVHIYSPHPDIMDPLEVMQETARVLKAIDQMFHITHMQGVPKEQWLIMK